MNLVRHLTLMPNVADASPIGILSMKYTEALAFTRPRPLPRKTIPVSSFFNTLQGRESHETSKLAHGFVIWRGRQGWLCKTGLYGKGATAQWRGRGRQQPEWMVQQGGSYVLQHSFCCKGRQRKLGELCRLHSLLFLGQSNLTGKALGLSYFGFNLESSPFDTAKSTGSEMTVALSHFPVV